MFEQIVNGLQAMRSLKNDCASGREAHCYVFASADQVLLDAFTEEAIYTLLGGADHNDLLYRKVHDRTHADVLYFPRTEKNFNTAEYEKLSEETGFSAIDGAKRIFVLDHAEAIKPPVQNRLLKTLEEPRQGVIFILKTESVAPLIATVRSRSRILELESLSTQSVKLALEQLTDADASDREWASEYAWGSIMRAKTLLSKAEYRGMCELAWNFLIGCDSSRDLLPWYTKFMSYEQNLEDLFLFLGEALRDIMIYLETGASRVIAKDRINTVREAATKFSSRAASAAIGRVQNALKRLESYNNKMSVTDTLLLGILEDKVKYPVKENRS